MAFSPSRNTAAGAFEYVNVKSFGAVGDGVADDYAAIAAAITYAATAVAGGTGKVVYFPTGTYLSSAQIDIPDRVVLQGANGRGSVIKPHSTFAASYLISAANGTSSMFSSGLRDLHIDGRGKNMTAVVRSQAWQETCTMERVLIQFDGTTENGFLYTDGYGGAAYLPLRDIEIFSNSTFASACGIRVNQISQVGGFVLSVDGATIAGDATNKLPIGIRMVKDSLIVKGYHAENISDTMISMEGAGALSGDTITGSSSAVNDLVTIGSGFTGVVNLRNLLPNDATGNVVKDNKTGRHIPVAAGMVPEFIWQPSAFQVALSADILDVTGNGAVYIVKFDVQTADYLDEYDPATGKFTAKRAGRYVLAASIKLANIGTATSVVVSIETTARSYEIARASTDTGVSFSGACVANMAAGDTAQVAVTVSGMTANSADIASGTSGSTFSGQWLSR